MKNFKTTIWLIILLYNNVFAQRVSEGDPTEIMRIIPSSPSASELGKFGGIPVGLSTGMPNLTIPIFNLIRGDLSVPISVNYSSNGLKVDQLAGRCGLGWNLMAGGVITRTVYGTPDESGQYLTPPQSFTTPSQELLNYCESASMGGNAYDTQYDMYSFNFGDYRGRFVIDKGVVHSLLHDGLKFELDKEGYRFKVTTPDGNKYYFGGQGAIESSRTTLSGANCGRSYDLAAPTAWYLQRIQSPKGQQIDFKYLPCYYSYPLTLTQSVTKMYPVPQFDCQGQAAGGAGYSDRLCTTGVDINGVYLDEINALSQGKIKFNYRNRDDLRGDFLLSGISVFSSQSSSVAIKEIQLDYIFARSTAYQNSFTTEELKIRPFLKELKEVAGNDIKSHQFDYYNINALPPRLSFAQDIFGYFNGKSNGSLLVTPADLDLQSIFPTAKADRNPFPSFAQLGMLSRVIYPTGGMDSLIYEGNTTFDKEVTLPPVTKLEARVTGTGIRNTKTFVTEPINVSVSQQAKFQAQVGFDGENFDALHHFAVVSLYNKTTNQYIIRDQKLTVGNYFNRNVYLVKNNTYIIEISANGSGTHGYGELEYRAGDPIERYTNITTGGLRIAYLKSFDDLTSKPNVKKYIYSKLGDLSKSSGRMVYKPVYERYFKTRVQCVPEAPGGNPDWLCMMSTYSYVSLYSNSLVNLYPYGGQHIYYANVVESNGENFENGGIEYTYQVLSDGPGRILAGLNGISDAPFSNFGWMNGLELAQKHFKFSNKVIIPVKDIYKTYKSDDRMSKEFVSYVIKRNYTRPCKGTPVTWEDLEPFDGQSYSAFCKWVYLDTMKTIDYDMEGKNPKVLLSTYTYENPLHAQLSKVSLEKSDGSKEVTLTTYPDDYGPGTIFIDNMKSNSGHLSGLPVEQIKYKEVGSTRTVLSGTITKYLAGGLGVVDQVLELESPKPRPLSTFKISNAWLGELPWEGNRTSFEPYSAYTLRLTYGNYDAFRNPQQVTPALGTPTTYIWSYGGQYPVAEIKNGAYSAVLAALGGATALSNFTSSSPTDAALKTFLAPLRTNAALKASLVTTYTYEQLKGMTSATDPSGRTTYYKYDGFGRLKEVNDTQSKTTDTYEYHYRQ
jgi:YD repeat-containing protein